MTQLTKNQITIAIKEELDLLSVPEDQLQAVTMRIARIVDEALADALAAGSEFGSILEAVGLEIRSKEQRSAQYVQI